MVEATTGWLETYPVPHATAQNTILGLEKRVLWRHGTPERIESDNGTHFRNNLIDTWAKEHGIEWVHKKLGGVTARTADPNWPKGYSIPYDVMLSIYTWGSWLGGVAIAAQGLAGVGRLDLSTECSTFRSKLAPTWPHAQPLMLQDVPAAAWTSSTATDASRCTCCSMDFIHSHRCFEAHLIQRGLILGPQSLQSYTCCGTDITMATDVSRYTCSGMGLSMGLSSPSTRAHTGVPACPVQQHRNSSDALAICQPRRKAIAVIKVFPGTA
ncbi:hypothetical protein QYF61_024347, partial [Mycteria americana]